MLISTVEAQRSERLMAPYKGKMCVQFGKAEWKGERGAAVTVFAIETECSMFGRPQGDQIDRSKKLGLGQMGDRVVQMGLEEI